jgi:hypothetical protein
MVVGFTMKPTMPVPVPAFIAAAIMESYATDPAELALTIVRAIKKRANIDPDPDRATALAEAASYVPRWVISIAITPDGRQEPRSDESECHLPTAGGKTIGRELRTCGTWPSRPEACFQWTPVNNRRDKRKTPFGIYRHCWSASWQTPSQHRPRRRSRVSTNSRLP